MSSIKPNELVYSIKRDFTCEPKDEIDQSKKIMTTQVTPKQPIDGIGPITCEGMPLTLRSVIISSNLFHLLNNMTIFRLFYRK